MIHAFTAALLSLLLVAPPLTPQLYLPAIATTPADCAAGAECAAFTRLTRAVLEAKRSYPSMTTRIDVQVFAPGGLNRRVEFTWTAENLCRVGLVVRVTPAGTMPILECPAGVALDEAAFLVWDALMD